MNGYLLSFLLSMLVAALLFLPFVIVDKGFFLYAGDYNSQQIPFYTYVHSMVKSGQMGYSWVSDLGGSLVNTYSFYLMGSPFFWLSTLFPTRWMPYLMVPLFILKFGVAGLSSYTYLQRYAKSRNYALIGALLYSFSGFSVYNIFFNHFLDVIALFPFMLWAMDEFFYNKRKGVFAVTVAINLINSYFFFVGQVVFLVIYFFIKTVTREYKTTFTEFGIFVFEAVLGCIMGIILAIPAFLNLIDNPRSLNTSNGFGWLMFSKVQQYFAIFASAFFPPDPPYLPNMFTEASVKWTSLSVYLPLLSFSGVIAYFKTKKKTALRYMMIAFMVMAFVPILNSSFYAFNWSYYARWYYMPILLFSCATMRVLQDEESTELLKKSIITTACITAAFIIIGITPKKGDGDIWKIGLAQDAPRFWLTILTALLGLLIFYILVSQRFTRSRFSTRIMGGVMAYILLFGIIHMSLTKFPQWENDANYEYYTYDAAGRFSLDDDSFYRVDVYKGEDNLGLHLNISSIYFFNSVVTPSIMEFYPSVGVKRDVSSKPAIDNYALRGLLSVKYLITPETNMETLDKDNLLYGFEYVKTSAGYAIYENTNYVPMGYTYNYYITEETFESITTTERAKVLMRAICLSDEQIEQYRSVLTELPIEQTSGIGFDSYTTDCSFRANESASSFETSHDGFTANIHLSRANLVFFSVPFDSGFTAYVNGIETPIEKVSNGMSAVYAPAGDNTIVFKYETPGLHLSIPLTFVGWGIWGVYMCFLFLQKKKKGTANT